MNISLSRMFLLLTLGVLGCKHTAPQTAADLTHVTQAHYPPAAPSPAAACWLPPPVARVKSFAILPALPLDEDRMPSADSATPANFADCADAAGTGTPLPTRVAHDIHEAL